MTFETDSKGFNLKFWLVDETGLTKGLVQKN